MENDLVMGVDVNQFNKPDYSNPAVVEHKRKFEEWLKSKYPITLKGTYVKSLEEIEIIRDVLNGAAHKTATDKFQFRKKRYSFNSELVVCQTTNKGTGVTIGPEVTLPLVYIENMFEKIYIVHALTRGHQGINKTRDAMNLRYHGCTELCISQFRKFCYVCNLNKIEQSQPRLQPIISSDIFERVQVDLIDMRNQTQLETIMTADKQISRQLKSLGIG